MKISKIASLVLVSSAAFLIGCGGSSSSSSSDVNQTDVNQTETVTDANQTVTIKASDAYVVALPSPATLKVGGQEFNTTDVNNGTITFTIPANITLDNTEFDVPGDAIVDADGDGKLSIDDQVIRMPLKTMEAGSIANPIATAALSRGDNEAYTAAKSFDPVEAKKQLILNPNDTKTKALVAISDGIAFLASEAKKNGKDPLEVVKAVNTDIVQQVASNPDVVTTQDITDVVQQVVTPAAEVAGVDSAQVAQKVENVVQIIEKAAEVVQAAKDKGIDNIDDLVESLTITAVAVSDADADITTLITHLDTIQEQVASGENVDVEDIASQIANNVKEIISEDPNVAQAIANENNEQTTETTGETNETAIETTGETNETAIETTGETNETATETTGETAQETTDTTQEIEGNTPPTPPATNTTTDNTTTDNTTTSSATISSLKVYFGDHEVSLNDGSFTSIVNLATEDNNLSKYFDINLSNVSVNGDNGTYTGNITVSVGNEKGNAAVILQNVQVEKSGDSIITKFVAGETKIGVVANGLTNVENALGTPDGETYWAIVDNTITNTDLVFNINTAINNAVQDPAKRDQVNEALNALNDYFNEVNESYEVNVSLDFGNNLEISPSNISGTFYVVNEPVLSLPATEVNITATEGQVFENNLTYTPTDANVSCSVTIDGVTCSADNGTITIEGNLSEGNYTGTLNVTQYVMNQALTTVNVSVNVEVQQDPLSQIPETARNNYVEVNNSNFTDTVANVTLDRVGSEIDDLRVYFEPMNETQNNSSATIAIRLNNDVIATLSPDDIYDGKTFYVFYNNTVKAVTYDKNTDLIYVDF